MTRKADYLDELKQLLESYSPEALAKELDVTIRSIQNYTTELNPTTPHPKTIIRIHETFAKHKKGVPITRAPEPKGESREDLEKSIYNLTEARLVEARNNLLNSQNIERLITMLEVNLVSKGIKIPKRGTPTTEYLLEEEEKKADQQK